MQSVNGPNTLHIQPLKPLADLVWNSSRYCQPECCGLDAFDPNAFTFLTWIRNCGTQEAETALQQLDTVISQAVRHEGPVLSDTVFCDAWDSGRACADYLQTWRDELARACFFFSNQVPSPEERLRAARTIGGSAWYLEVGRLMGEAGMSDSPEAIRILTLIASLDEHEPPVNNDVLWARKRLEEIALSKEDAVK